MSGRRGFTLIELLVVVAVIAVLAGLLIPTIGIVRRMANDIKCGSQLQQIAGAIEVYKGENDGAFPGRLFRDPADLVPGATMVTDDLFHNGGPLEKTTKILLCPFDVKNGADTTMGRSPTWTNLSDIHTPGSSYEYDVSDHYLQTAPDDEIGWFFATGDRPTANTAASTWAAGKHNQLVTGNTGDSGVAWTDPFPSTQFPIIRCYWHHKWNGSSNDEKVLKKVNNVSWDLNVFWSSPYWEHDINSAIPLPP